MLAVFDSPELLITTTEAAQFIELDLTHYSPSQEAQAETERLSKQVKEQEAAASAQAANVAELQSQLAQLEARNKEGADSAVALQEQLSKVRCAMCVLPAHLAELQSQLAELEAAQQGVRRQWQHCRSSCARRNVCPWRGARACFAGLASQMRSLCLHINCTTSLLRCEPFDACMCTPSKQATHHTAQNQEPSLKNTKP